MKIYPMFKWPGKIWITSDFHFNHPNILIHERTEFKTIEEHNKYIIDRVNEVVTENDTLIMLGDIGFEKGSEVLMNEIKCYKVLLTGNHDKLSKTRYSEYFNEVYDGPILISPTVMLSHYPVPTDGYFFNIHGHMHGSFIDSPYNINLSSKLTEYKPLVLNKVVEIANKNIKLKKKNEDFLEEWYKNKTKFIYRRSEVPCFKDDELTEMPLLGKKVQTYTVMKYAREIVDFLRSKEFDIDSVNWDAINNYLVTYNPEYNLDDVLKLLELNINLKIFIKTKNKEN